MNGVADLRLAAGDVRIGTSGWSYDHWRDVLYPRGTGPRRLETYAQSFDTVELNSSFYHWPRRSSFESWAARVPPGFLIAVKAPRGLTHARKLASAQAWSDRLAEGSAGLGEARGPLLLQLPPDLERDDERLASALDAMPRECRVAVELRHASWVADDVFALLRDRDAAYCVMSGARMPLEPVATTDFVYVRFHGPDPERLYVGSYDDVTLAWWADRIAEWRGAGLAVLCYFNNDGGGAAVRDARRLRELTAR
ncbi:MAG: DUF72 domain-containing protein [Microbacterium sp.]|uniref:DUF72 domain-containing protein n=1 Tax=Microbacterium sp. TaxID=51671 RepID=UPI003F7CF9DA